MTETDPDPELTDTPKARHEYLSTFVSAVTILAFLGIVLGTTLEMVTIETPGPYLMAAFLAVVLASYTYAIGLDVVEIFSQIRGRGSE